MTYKLTIFLLKIKISELELEKQKKFNNVLLNFLVARLGLEPRLF